MLSLKDINLIRSIREINNLCHFTSLNNVKYILKHGLVPRKQLLTNHNDFDFEFDVNDEIRLEQREDCNCLSISFPNNKMFYSARNKRNNQWAVLICNIECLLPFKHYFYPMNAACTEMRSYETRHNLSNLDAFSAMFENETDKYTRDVQAEILIEGVITINYLREIHLPSQVTLNQASLEKFNKQYPWIKIITSDALFSNIDYAKRNFSSILESI